MNERRRSRFERETEDSRRDSLDMSQMILKWLPWALGVGVVLYFLQQWLGF